LTAIGRRSCLGGGRGLSRSLRGGRGCRRRARVGWRWRGGLGFCTSRGCRRGIRHAEVSAHAGCAEDRSTTSARTVDRRRTASRTLAAARSARRVELVRADGTVHAADTRSNVAALVEVAYGRSRADRLVAGVDRGAACPERDGSCQSTIVNQPRRVEQPTFSVAQRTRAWVKPTRRAGVEIVAAVNDGARAIQPENGRQGRNTGAKNGVPKGCRSAGDRTTTKSAGVAGKRAIGH
jgi:hypothetical protein